ncbi:MAG: LysR family transcriptional regulator [Nitrococcus sp.]|nr:LysR family transcriptional regulator [Nitrococcus sp.]
MIDGFDKPKLQIRVKFTPAWFMGPGKADLLDLIDKTGSIAAAGREMGMSYKRAWQLVETMNAMFRDPLVESTRGGASGGGAALTPIGKSVLAAYRKLEVQTERVGQDAIEEMQSLLGDTPGRK